MPKSNWPKYYHDKLYLGDPKSSTALVTLWTVKEKICHAIPAKYFSVAGQLYSKRGINFLLRNILANPSIRTIVICGRDETKSGQALLAFVKNGVDAKYQVRGADNLLIDREIPLEQVELLRRKVKFIDLIGNDDPAKISAVVRRIKHRPPFARPKVFPMPRVSTARCLPAEAGIQTVRGRSVSTVWPALLRRLMRFGVESRHFHGSQVKEIFNLTAVVTGENSSKPKLIPEFGFNATELKSYIKNFLSPVKGKEEYTYGSRMRDFRGINQVDEMARKIKGYPNDRGALSVLWDPTTDNAPRKVPCLSLVQANGEGDKLHITAYFRSNDMFNGWPRNALALRALQAELARKTGMKVGWLTTISNCAHIYENEWQLAESVVKKYSTASAFEPDPRGDVLVEVHGGKIAVTHLAPGGQILHDWSFDGQTKNAALKIIKELQRQEVFSDVYHSAYLGAEIQRAVQAIRNKKKYEQDKG